MRRSLAALALALALTLAGGAAADTFALVQSGPAALPSAEEPNLAASLLLPPGVFSGPATAPQLLDEAALRDLWQRAGAAYGIPWELLASINKIESNFGRNMGPSSAGAIGWMQFMPDTWLAWGMDGSGDGFSDPWNAEDAVYSAARYLAAAGGRFDLQRAVFSYNHAQWYVDQVLQLAALYAGGGVQAAFALDRMQVDLEQAQADVIAARDALARSEAAEAALQSAVAELDGATGGLELLSDQLEAQKNVFQLDWRRAEASAEVARLREALAEAEAVLAAARTGAVPAAFFPAAAALLGAPLAVEDYVFPVGGGPGVVSVAHGHHDYAAADIAAPEGSPVYALAAAVVLEAWPDPTERCGIGVQLLTGDGLVWSYCHLAYLEPGAAPGAALAAGAFVGLVGSTGRSTGPHLHLGLKPASYPQEMPWFQAFAGTAFTWQDAPTDPVARSGPIFSVLPPSEATVEPAGEVVEFTLDRG